MIILKLTDEVLYKNIPIACEELMNEFQREYSERNCDTQKFVFSELFQKRMNKMIKRNTKSRRWLKQISRKVACIGFVLALGTLTLTLSAEAYRKQVFQAITAFFDGYTSTSYHVDDPLLADTQNIYYPTYIPKGYHFVTEHSNDISSYRLYQTDNDESFTFHATRISEHIVICRDSEYQSSESVNINGITGEFRVKDNSYRMLLFANDYIEYNLISDDLNKKELIKIAESISLEH